MIENQKGRKVKVLSSNNGGEYTSKELKDYLTSKGIEQLRFQGDQNKTQ